MIIHNNTHLYLEQVSVDKVTEVYSFVQFSLSISEHSSEEI